MGLNLGPHNQTEMELIALFRGRNRIYAKQAQMMWNQQSKKVFCQVNRCSGSSLTPASFKWKPKGSFAQQDLGSRFNILCCKRYSFFNSLLASFSPFRIIDPLNDQSLRWRCESLKILKSFFLFIKNLLQVGRHYIRLDRCIPFTRPFCYVNKCLACIRHQSLLYHSFCPLPVELAPVTFFFAGTELQVAAFFISFH